MSFYTNRIVSFFPDKHKIRRDQSSNGFRFFNSFSKVLENIYYETFVLRKFLTYAHRVRQIEALYIAYLESKDKNQDEQIEYVKPIVYYGERRLDYIDNYTDFLKGLPYRLDTENKVDVTNWEIWSSESPDTYNDILESEHLLIDFSNLEDFLVGGTKNQKNYEFFFNYFVIIEGFDELYNPIKETIFVSEKELVLTRKTFKEISSVEWDGFEGDFKIFLTSKKHDYKKLILEHDYDVSLGKLKKNIKINIIEEGNKSYLRNHMTLTRAGVLYSGALDLKKEIFLLDQVLLDSSNNYLSIVDYCVDPRNKTIWALDDASKLHAFEKELNIFQNLKETVAGSPFLTFEEPLNRVGLEEEVSYGAIFRDYSAGIESYEIYRYTPSGTKNYYNNGTWSSSSYSHSLDTNSPKIQRLVGIDFKNHFNEVGQWEFYVKTKYRQFESEEIIGVAVICEYNKALKSYDLSSKGSFDGVFINKEDKICLSSNNSFYTLSEEYDVYSYSPLKEEIIFRTPYDEVEIIMPVDISVVQKGSLRQFTINGQAKDTIILKENENHILQQMHFNNSNDSIFLSNSSSRDEALSLRKDCFYLINEEKVSYNDYIQKLIEKEYTKAEVMFFLEECEELFGYSENDKNLKFKISSTSLDIFQRVNENYGYL